MSETKMKRRGAILLITLLCLALLIYFLPVVTGRVIPDSGVSSLMFALQRNDSIRSKLLVSPERWDDLDKWEENHTATQCKFFGWNRSGVIYSQPDQTHWIGSYSLACEANNEDGFYCMYTKELRAVRTQLGWLVVDWSPILEGTSRDSCVRLPIETLRKTNEPSISNE